MHSAALAERHSPPKARLPVISSVVSGMVHFAQFWLFMSIYKVEMIRFM